jgi:RNA polymerase sigma factor (sigma-70 family)
MATLIGHLRKLAAAGTAAELSDAELLKRFADERDAAAFEVLVQRHAPLVLGVCRRVLANSHDVDDAFQATFLVLARKAGAKRWQASIAGWLHTVAHHVARQTRDSGKRHGIADVRTRRSAPEDPLSEISGRELLALLDEELSRVPEKYRAPLVLCYLEGLPRDAAARRLGCPLGTLKSRLERGRELLRRRLTSRGVSLPVATLVAALVEDSIAHAGYSLVSTTAQAALPFAAGSPAGGVLSARVVALAEVVGKSLLATKWNVGVVVVLLLSALAVGGGLTFYGGTDAQTAKEAQRPAVTDHGAEKKKPTRTDQYGDPLPPAALARMGSVRFRHGGVVESVVFAQDGKSLISGARDGTIRKWDAEGREVWRLRAQGRLVFSGDGKQAAASEELGSRIQLVDAAAGKHLRTLQIKKGWLRSVALVPGGKTLVAVIQKPGSADAAVVVLDASTGRELHRLTEVRREPWRIALAAHGHTIASADADGTLRLWDVDTGKALRKLDGHKGPVRALAFSPAGDLLASGGDDGTLRLWNIAAGKELRQERLTKEGRRAVSSVAFSADGTTLAASFQGQKADQWGQWIRLWRVADWKKTQSMRSPLVFWISAVAFSPDGKMLVSTGDSCIHRWDVATGKELESARQSELLAVRLALSPDGMTLATRPNYYDGIIDLWHVANGRRIRQLRGHEGMISELVFASDGRRLVSSGAKTVRLWDVATGEEIRRLSHPDRVIALAPDGRTLASVGRGPVVRLWDMKTGKQLRALQVPVAPRPAEVTDQLTYPLAISPDGQVIAVREYAATEQGASVVHLLDLATGKKPRRIKGHNSGIYGLAFSPDGRYLATAENIGVSALSLWDVATGREVRQFGPPELFGRGIPFSPDGRTLFAGRRDNTVRLYEVATGQVRHALEGHQGSVLDGAFSADGTILVTTSSDGTALVWDLAGRLQQRRLSRAELEARWSDLAGADAARAYQAILAFAASAKEAVALLSERMPPIVPADPAQIKSLLADLNSADFSRRQQASQAIERLGFRAEPALRDALTQQASLEARRRIDRLLAKLDGPETLRLTRTIETLELIASAEARRHLRALSQGPPASRLSQEARAALQRISSRIK